MNDLDPNLLLPLWRAVVAYFSHYRPLAQAEQRLPAGGTREARS